MATGRGKLTLNGQGIASSSFTMKAAVEASAAPVVPGVEFTCPAVTFTLYKIPVAAIDMLYWHERYGVVLN